MQVTALIYDEDTGVLEFRLDDGTEFRIENAGHARVIRDKVSVGGRLTDIQRAWLDHYYVPSQQTNRARLKARLGEIRTMIREL